MSDNGKTTQEHLRQFVEQIERLEDEKKGISDDIRDKYTEAAALGFDKKALRLLIKKRKMSKHEREELESILEVYESALGL